MLIKEGKTNWKYILIVVILAVIVGGGVLVWTKKQEVPSTGLPETEEKEVEDETADWKTYRNEWYGFEIKYPEDWIFNQDVMSFGFSSGKLINGSDEFSCSLNIALATKGTNAEYINSLPKEKWQRSEIDINRESTIKLTSVDSPIKAYYFLENSGEYSFQIYHSTTRYITNQEGYRVALGFIYYQECMDIFNQMLSIFKFLE